MEEEIIAISTGGIVFISIIGLLLFALPRRYALLPLLICGCYMTLGQVLMIGPLHFSIFRIILFLGWLRILFRKELFNIKLCAIDKVLMVWVVVSFLVYVVNRGGTSAAIIGRLGTSYNTIGTYFLMRALIRDFDDVVRAVKMTCVIIIPLAVIFVIEHVTSRNLFSIFGGLPEFTEIRDGRLRCQGAFRHPILAGTFAATCVPLFIGLRKYSTRNRTLIAGGILAALTIVYVSASSGPLLACIVSIVGLLLWHFRAYMKAIRWGVLLLVIALHLVMKAPVWFLISKISGIMGMGTGWHRSALIDASIKYFDEWWLMGTTYTAHWMPTGLANNPDSADITNQFIVEGVNGGLISMLLFIWLLVKCFSATGTAIHDKTKYSTLESFFIWAMGCALFGHIASFFSVLYFDQIIIFWYLLIASIAVLGATTKKELNYQPE